jgi:tetratricopeptide (TPR) repeat protein
MNLGIDVDMMIILTAIMAIGTLVLIFFAYKQLRISGGMNLATAELTKELMKFSTPLNTKEPRILPREDIKKLEERIYSIKDIKESFILDMFIELGTMECTHGDLRKALVYYDEVLKRANSIGDSKRIAFCLNNIGNICFRKGDLNDALRYYKDALRIDRNIGYKRGEADSLNNIGNICFRKGDLNDALRYYKDALRIDRNIGYKRGESIDLGNIAMIYMEKGDLDKAEKYQKEAESCFYDA